MDSMELRDLISEIAAVDPESGTSNMVQEETLPNAMTLNPIIRCILQHLSLKDLKTCSQVSKEWSSVARIILRGRSNIFFCKHSQDDNWDRTPDKFHQEFSSTLNTVPFTNFKIYCCGEPWKISELADFFLRQRKNIRQLSLVSLYLVDDDGNDLATFDISPWISGTALAELSTGYPTKLYLHSPNLMIQSSVLANVRSLDLRICQLVLQTGVQIRPISLALMNVMFIQNGAKLTSMLINDVVDFSKAKHISLICDYYDEQDSKDTAISLDLNEHDKLVLENLFLSKVTIRNWSNCRWKVRKLDMCKIPFLEKTEMQVPEIIFQSSEIDFSVVPQSTEKLELRAVDCEDCFCTTPTILQNLSFLVLSDSNCLPLFKELVSCPKLVAIHLVATAKQLVFNLELIPATVKKLKLAEVALEGFGGYLSLDKLVLEYYCLSDVETICSSQIQTKELILTSTVNMRISKFLAYRERLLKCGELLYAGPFEKCNCPNISISDFVDVKAEFYDFTNQTGKAVGIEDFKKIASVDN